MNWWNPLDWGELMVEGVKSKTNEIFVNLIKDLVASSYWICLIAGVIGLIFYLFGSKKGKNTATMAPIVYLIIRILSSVLVNV